LEEPKPENIFLILLYNPLDESAAEVAHAVKENEGVTG
jgi:hypothetical protein